jgi:hypothetical protein
LPIERDEVLEKKEASNTFRHPTIRIASVEELTLLEKSNLLICEERLERLNQVLDCL